MMANYCTKCGTELDKDTGMCPNCFSKEHLKAQKKLQKKEKRREKKAEKKRKKKERILQLTRKQRVKRFLTKMLLGILLATGIATAGVAALNYFGVINLTDFFGAEEQDYSEALQRLGTETVEMKELEVFMQSETEGSAKVCITIPNYEKLFIDAFQKRNPEKYLVDMLEAGQYEILEFFVEVPVTVENGQKIFQTEEIQYQILEEELIKATNAVTEVE